VSRGELDAVLLFLTDAAPADRSVQVERTRCDGMHPLFADPIEESARYFRATGVVPLNHCVVIRRQLAKDHPWLPQALYHAFERSRQWAFEQLSEYALLAQEQGESVNQPSRDPYAYGLRANRKAIDTLLRYQVEQGLLGAALQTDEIFAASCLDT
jgi:4,5-dihydroxyphthalate decarboxylase